jgi:hypothetical protein
MRDPYGMWRRPEDDAAIQAMFMPARCVCGQVYDLGKVEVTARYSDCSMWKAPCCGRTADDRYETGWSSVRHYYLLQGPS